MIFIINKRSHLLIDRAMSCLTPIIIKKILPDYNEPLNIVKIFDKNIYFFF